MTEGQFIELVEEALNYHISRDPKHMEDWRWEAENFARKLSEKLRVEGFKVPVIGKTPGRADGARRA